MSDFKNLITRDEDQKQFLLQVVQEYRKKFPDSSSKQSNAIVSYSTLIPSLFLFAARYV